MFRSILPSGSSHLRGYAVAVAGVAVSYAVTWVFWHTVYPSITPLFLAAVTVAALLGGLRAGLLATVLSAGAVLRLMYIHGDVHQLGIANALWTLSFLLVAFLGGSLWTARRRAEQLLKEREYRLRLASEQIPAALWSTDLDLRLTTVFGADLPTLGASSQPLNTLFPRVAEGDPLTVAHRRALSGQASGRDLDWRGRAHQCHVEPLRGVDGDIIGTIGVALDITERKRMEQRLEEAKAEAEQATAAKDRFLAMLSHELRTPLTPVLAVATALEVQTDLPAAVREDLGLIRRNAELEAMLIDDLLDLTRVVNNKLRLDRRPIDLHTAIRAALEICRPDADDKGVALNLDLGARQATVLADPARLQQVFWNLIKNAIKFTPAGGTICVRTDSGASADTGQAVVEVIDTGIGIDPDVLPRIFDAFEQGKATITQQFGGLGLGLAISKAIVTMHDGTIAARSAGRHQGATFAVALPLAAEPQPAESPGESPGEVAAGLRGLRVLLVEDHADTARILARLLSAAGCEVRTAGSIAAALSAIASEPFDALVSDLGLPDGSGYDLMHQAASQGTPVKGIALSGFGMEEDVRKAKEAGFVEHLTKPVDVKQLKAVISRVARQHVAPSLDALTKR